MATNLHHRQTVYIGEIEIANDGLQGPQKRDDDWTEKIVAKESVQKQPSR